MVKIKNKYKILISVLFISLLSMLNVMAEDVPCLEGTGPLLIGQSYCPDYYSGLFNFFAPQHYEIQYLSTFTHYFFIDQDEDDPLSVFVNFGFDLNNLNPTLSSDKYQIVENFDFYNYIRPSSSRDMIENYQDFRKSELPENVEEDENDFIGFPLYLTTCYIDCDLRDNVPAKTFDLTNYNDIWYRYVANTRDPNNNDNLVSSTWLNERFNPNGIFFETNKALRFENNFYQCKYDSGGEKEVYMGCTMAVDDYLRYPNIDSDFNFWGFSDFLSNTISPLADDQKYYTFSRNIVLDLDNDNYTILNITSVAPDGGDYIPPGGEGMLEQYDSTPNIEEQKDIYLLKQNSELENLWQNTMINISKVFFSIFMIIFYIFEMFVLLFVFFGSLPFIFRKFHENLEKLSDIKIKRGFK